MSGSDRLSSVTFLNCSTSLHLFHVERSDDQIAGGAGRSRVYELLTAGELTSDRLGRRRWVTRTSVGALLARAEQQVS